jgi:hypothetical protein
VEIGRLRFRLHRSASGTVHRSIIEDVVKQYPGNKCLPCFAITIKKETGLEPWVHATNLGREDFSTGVEANKLMEPYD